MYVGGPDPESGEMDMSQSNSAMDLSGLGGQGQNASSVQLGGQRAPQDRVRIALSLYKVQQNIYLLDFQRIEVRH